MTALDNLLNRDFVNFWFRYKKNDPEYEYYRYPAKMMMQLENDLKALQKQ